MIKLNELALMMARRTELIAAFVVLAVVFMIIAPLPTWLMDILIAVNICVACLLIILSLYIPNPLAFSTFPAVLLLTTLFRLAVSIATTRQILLEQSGGDIIQSFGEFVAGGNLAVGLVIFLIITIVNFLVITKGSERVAEVSARFSLDGLPGKQMSIDSDLRANLITPDMAKSKRDKLGRESQLFGAMDGAMKFVKGEAIAGLIILAINLIGGLIIGMMQLGMGAGEALQVFALLTIGDGLIAQIPALLISLTAGFIITRVSKDENDATGTNVGREIVAQVTSEPKAWMIASAGMLLFAVLPGMPTVVFITMSIATGACGYLQYRRRKDESDLVDVSEEEIPPETIGDEDVRSFTLSRPFVIKLHEVYRSAGNTLSVLQAIRRTRNSIVSTYGLTLPVFDIDYRDDLPLDELCFCIYEVPVLRGSLTDRVAIRRGPLPRQPDSAEEGRSSREEEQYLWVKPNDPLLSEHNITSVSSTDMIVQRIKQQMFAAGPRFLGVQESTVIMSWLEQQQPHLAQELQRIMPMTRFSGVLQRLASERVPIRAVRLIAEALVEHGQHERELAALTDYARIMLKDQIYDQFHHNEILHVWLLTPETEDIFRDALRQTQTGICFNIESNAAQSLVAQLSEAFPWPDVITPAVLLVAQDLRSPMRDLLQEEFNHVPVLSFSELKNTANLRVLGHVDLQGGALLQEKAA